MLSTTQCWPCRYSVAIMLDTEGSEVHTNELEQPIKAEVPPLPPLTLFNSHAATAQIE